MFAQQNKGAIGRYCEGPWSHPERNLEDLFLKTIRNMHAKDRVGAPFYKIDVL